MAGPLKVPLYAPPQGFLSVVMSSELLRPRGDSGARFLPLKPPRWPRDTLDLPYPALALSSDLRAEG